MQDFPPYRQIFAPHFPAQVRNAILSVVAVALTILLLDGWRSINSYQNTLRESSENLNDLSRLIAEQTEATFELADSLLASNVAIMESGPLEANTKTGIHLSLVAVVKNSPRISAVSVFDAQGSYLNGSFTNTDAGKLNYANREYFAHHRDHPDKILYIGQPIQRKSTGEWAISLSHRWNKPDASFGGGIASVVNLTYFQDFFKTVKAIVAAWPSTATTA